MSEPLLPLLVQPEQLQALLGDERLLIVDLRTLDDYAEGHVPGAVHLAYAQLVKAVPPAMGLLPEPEQLSAVLSAVGLTPERHVVAYDDEGNGRAGRLLWTLDVLGHARFSLLDGGFLAWEDEDYPLEERPVAPTPSQYRYQARIANPAVAVDKQHILERLGQSELALLDTRSPGEFQGLDVRARRGGHIPGAVNLNWTDTMDPENNLRLRPDAELRALLEDRGVTPDKEVIVYCQTHHRSAHTYMVLKYLGYPRVAGYPGAWSEWGNDMQTPVER